ncbi:MAG: sigma-70 family RNA polymerase sigma factor [Alphaproteobacteria bacterium]|nr:sigma-70 family RNA polymerase sigma factor [Alphaproteobacteria bacterium]
MARVAERDVAAWTAIIERHLGALVATAWHVTGDRAEADDVAQETFVRLMAKARDWRSDCPPLRAWLHRVAVNLSIDRRRARRTVPLDETMPGLEAESGDPLRDAAITRAVGRVMEQLPRRQRAAIALVHYQGFSGQEAAQMLEVSVEALESLLARARRALRLELTPLLSKLLERD